jgi:hypothetical protein
LYLQEGPSLIDQVKVRHAPCQVYGRNKEVAKAAQIGQATTGDPNSKLLRLRKEHPMTNEMTILSEGVILDDMVIEEMEEVVAPAIYATAG